MFLREVSVGQKSAFSDIGSEMSTHWQISTGPVPVTL